MYVTLGLQHKVATSDHTIVSRVTMLTDMAKEEVAKESPTRKSFFNSDGRVGLKERNPKMFAIKKEQYRMKLARYMGLPSKNGNEAVESAVSISVGNGQARNCGPV